MEVFIPRKDLIALIDFAGRYATLQEAIGDKQARHAKTLCTVLRISLERGDDLVIKERGVK